MAQASKLSARRIAPAPKRRIAKGIPVLEDSLWTQRQRQMHPIHYAVSYRASFKPELPDFFINRFCTKGPAVVFDPFGGRGTTVLQANLLGHTAIHNDVNPVASFLCAARAEVPPLETLLSTLEGLDLSARRPLSADQKDRLLPFFHKDTLREILNLRELVIRHREGGDPALRYIGLTALSRLYGHSDGFFSVYTFPQISIMPGAQRRNNLKRGQTPIYKNVRDRIARKMRRDLGTPLPAVYAPAARKNRYLCQDVRDLQGLESGSVDLIVTSPPFLDKVNYKDDNWMRAWFLDVEEQVAASSVTMTPNLSEWLEFMRDSIREFGRVLKRGGRAVIEVGEVVHAGQDTLLEEEMLSFLPMRVLGGTLRAEQIFVNAQSFTKLSNCWDVQNNRRGTNTNRCLVLEKR